MLIGFSMPAMTVGITGGTWLTSDNGAALVDGKPARKSRIDATSPCAITLTAAAAFKPRIIAVLGLVGVAAGTVITATTAGGTALGSADVVQFADGTLGCWIVNAGSVSTTTVKISIPVTGQIDIGEIVAMLGLEVPIRDGWTIETVDPTPSYRSRGSQLSSVPQTGYRTLSVQFAGKDADTARGGALDNGMDWAKLVAALQGKARAIVIPHYLDVVTKAADPEMRNATAIYGVATELPSIANMQRQYFTARMGFEEIPA